MYILQQSVFPTYSLCSEKELYFRFDKNVDLNMNSSTFFLRKMGRLFTDTYFNSVSVGKWKRHTIVDNLNLTIKLKGKVKITWFLHRPYFSGRILAENYLSTNESEEVIIPLDFWLDLEDGMLSFEIEALEDSEIF